MSISPRFMNELRDRLPLSETVGSRVKLARAGREFKGCCPFHHEKTPSFYVNDDKQFYHCFGCGAHGDIINFVMQHDNLSFIEAIEALSAQAGMKMPDHSPQDAEKARQEKSLYTLMDDAARYFSAQLFGSAGADARRYLAERGLKEETLHAFRLGFAPADRQAMRAFLRGKGYTDAQMMDVALLRQSDRDGSHYAFFRDRVIFPVIDLRGRVIAFGGRVLPEHMRPPEPAGSGYVPAKYMNSSDTPVFHKGRVLYGESHARQAAGMDGQNIVVVEGYLDVISCFEAGFRGAVAPMGTALTDDQIAKIWKMIPGSRKMPVLCFDGDNAGRRAAYRACENLLPLLQPDQSAMIAFLPDGQDPDSLIKKDGPAAFAAVLEKAVPLADYIWNYHTAGQGFATPEERAGLSRTLDDHAARIADRTVQQYYRQLFRDRLYHFFRPPAAARGTGSSQDAKWGDAKWGDAKWSAQRGKGNGRPAIPPPALPSVRKKAGKGGPLTHRILLAALINHPAIFSHVEEEISQVFKDCPDLDPLLQALVSILYEKAEIDREALCDHLRNLGFERELDSLFAPVIYTHAGFARPDTGEEDVLSGWRETCMFLHRKALRTEIREAGKALAEDFSAENEQKMLALHDVHKTSG